ncbi:MAG: arylsulfatase [Rhodopirellula sp. JB053]
MRGVVTFGLFAIFLVKGGTRNNAAFIQGAEIRPNIVVILADDMGYSDLGCTGAEIRTPNLDALAQRGVLFTRFYNTSRCCPSRACLLTGQYQWDAGLGHMTYTRSQFPEYQQSLSDRTPTVAEVLRDSGYQTVMSGKWHVGDQREDWPDRRGFERFYGTPAGGGLYFYPSPFYPRSVYRDGVEEKPGVDWYSTDGFTDYAIEFVAEKRDRSRPFFLYLAFIAPHYPLQAKSQDIDRYRDTYDVGFSVIRNARFEKQVSLGLFSESTKPSEAIFPDWAQPKDRNEQAARMATYAAQVDCLDQNVGRLVEALKQEGVYDNTVMIFLSDNGGCSKGFNKTPDAEIGSRESNASYGNWFNVSNTPFRMAKSQVHEGGIVTPLIMHWPNGIGVRPRKIDAPAHIMDLFPTCLELADVKDSASPPSVEVEAVDGISLLPAIRGDAADPNRVLYWEHEGNKAVRRGDWKLVALRKGAWELYDLRSDPFEKNDLAERYPERVDELRALYSQWAQLHGVRTWPVKR